MTPGIAATTRRALAAAVAIISSSGGCAAATRDLIDGRTDTDDLPWHRRHHSQMRPLQRELQATTAAGVSCTCSPRSYRFRLALDGDCASASSTLTADGDDALSNVNCQITSVASRTRRRLDGDVDGGGETKMNVSHHQPRLLRNQWQNEQQRRRLEDYHYYFPVWEGGGYCDNDPSRRGDSLTYETAEACCEAV